MATVGLPANKERRPKDWTPEQQLIALHQTHGLSGEALQTWCRENGLFAHHLSSWKVAFCAGAKAVDGSQEIRVLKDEVKQFKREIARKDHALANEPCSVGRLIRHWVINVPVGYKCRLTG